MSFMDEINELAEKFSEISRREAEVKRTQEFKDWYDRPFKPGSYSEQKFFPITLWPNTPRETLYQLSITKGLRCVTPPMPKRLKKLLDKNNSG